jgi:hypothetical protein
MPYVKAWCGADDDDVLEIVEGLERGERSAWIRDAIREKAGRVRGEATPPAASSVDLAPVVSALHRISDQLSEITIAQAPAEPIKEDPDAAARLGSMF